MKAKTKKLDKTYLDYFYISVILVSVLLLFATSVKADDKTNTIDLKPTKTITELSVEINKQNPLNGHRTLCVKLNKDSFIKIAICDMSGNKVREITAKQVEPGVYKFEWDGKNNQGQRVQSGVYKYKVETEKEEQTNIFAYL